MDYEEIKRRDMEFITGKKQKSGKKNKAILILLIAFLIVVLVCGAAFVLWVSYGKKINKDKLSIPALKTETVKIDNTKPKATLSPTLSPTPKTQRRGSWEPIPDEVFETMQGISYPEGARVHRDDLAYLTIPHYDFDGKIQKGKMIVARSLADEVLAIFAELSDIKYPIEKMELIDKYDKLQTEEFNSLDRSSMGRNNTSSFCYRTVSGTKNLSKHAYGRAIDINPKINPWVSSSGTVSPRNATKYADRSMADWTDVEKRAYIGEDTEIYRIFDKYGWFWGGHWNSRDYQHFEKP